METKKTILFLYDTLSDTVPFQSTESFRFLPFGAAWGSAEVRESECIVACEGTNVDQKLRFVRQLNSLSIAPTTILIVEPESAAIVKAFEAGFDDVVRKDQTEKELLPRIERLRRGNREQSKKLAFEDLEVDTTTRTARVGSQVLVLTEKEFKLLKLLLTKPGEVSTKQEISLAVWHKDYHGDSNIMTVYVCRLRKIISQVNSKVEIITVSNLGYMLTSSKEVRVARSVQSDIEL